MSDVLMLMSAGCRAERTATLEWYAWCALHQRQMSTSWRRFSTTPSTRTSLIHRVHSVRHSAFNEQQLQHNQFINQSINQSISLLCIHYINIFVCIDSTVTGWQKTERSSRMAARNLLSR